MEFDSNFFCSFISIFFFFWVPGISMGFWNFYGFKFFIFKNLGFRSLDCR